MGVLKNEIKIMRQIAEKLEVGKWYADLSWEKSENVCFLKYHSETTGEGPNFENRGNTIYTPLSEDDSLLGFPYGCEFYLPTEEDVEKYNLR